MIQIVIQHDPDNFLIFFIMWKVYIWFLVISKQENVEYNCTTSSWLFFICVYTLCYIIIFIYFSGHDPASHTALLKAYNDITERYNVLKQELKQERKKSVSHLFPCSMEVVQCSRGLFCGYVVTPLCQQFSYSHGVCLHIQGWQHSAYVIAAEEVLCCVYVCFARRPSLSGLTLCKIWRCSS